jgi:hypothetical protein
MSQLNASSFLFSRTAGFYDHEIEQSLRFEDGDSAYLSRTPASASNRKTWTWSGWVKRGNLGTTQQLFQAKSGTNYVQLGFTTENKLQIQLGSPRRRTNRLFRDVGAWYNIVAVLDTTNATGDDRLQLWVNGERLTSFDEDTDPTLNADYTVNSTATHNIGRGDNTHYFDGYMAEVNFIDGQALDPTSFGETKSGIWIPKDTSGLTFGTNGFRLAYADSGAIGDDTSGNTNDFTANNLVASDVVLDSPTNNFGVMSSVDKGDGTATYSEGNLKVSVGDNEEAFGSFGMSSGKWYWEIRYISTASGNNKIGLGIADTAAPNNNEVTNNGHQGTTYAPNDILAVAVDVDNELFSFYKNGTIIETDTDWSAKGWTSIKPIVTSSNSAGEEVCVLNFGQDDTFAGAISATGNTDGNGQGVFKYTPPSGFLALCSANLPSGAIDTAADETPEDYFNTVLYSATSGVAGSVTGYGFAPDWLWTKTRNTTQSHQLFDNVRGDGVRLITNSTGAEADLGASYLSLEADGFDYGTSTFTSNTYVGWGWKAGGAGVANTDGTLSSTVSVGATSQQNWFSIVSYTGNATAGATIGHGLGVAPDMIIVKSRDNARDWRVYHSSLGSSYTMDLNTTNAVQGPNSAYWNSTDPTSSVFSVGSVTTVNGSGEDYIAYCFANAEGLCKAGNYGPGTGNSDGPFVFTGFRPAFVLAKRYDGVVSWPIWDNRRDGYNATNKYLLPNLSNAESSASSTSVDFLSNGFKFRGGSAIGNVSGGNYIYLAIAEQPFKYSNAR